MEAGAGNDDGDADMQEDEQQGLSPTEQHDVDDLVNDYKDVHDDLGLDDRDGFLGDDDEEEEYEALFRELISQSQNEVWNRPTEANMGDQTGSDPSLDQESRERYASGMDLS